MTQLSVNVNKIAILRNSRGGNDPDVLQAARTCIAAGAHGITVHPRPDRRHIHAEDVLALAELTAARQVEFNIEGNPFAPPREGYPGLLELCRLARPQQVTLVPDGDGQLAAQWGADRIELYTGPYAEAHATGNPATVLAGFVETARQAQAAGLAVNAGHDLSQANLGEFLAAVPNVLEVSIGHALIGEALYQGLDTTVRAYLQIAAQR
jgi:pyridoxine 5-phosphate synthase